MAEAVGHIVPLGAVGAVAIDDAIKIKEVGIGHLFLTSKTAMNKGHGPDAG